jgi:hypothetical protein
LAGTRTLSVGSGSDSTAGSKFLFPGLEKLPCYCPLSLRYFLRAGRGRFWYSFFSAPLRDFYGRAYGRFWYSFFPAPLRDFYGRAYGRFWYSFFSAPMRDFYGRAVVLPWQSYTFSPPPHHAAKAPHAVNDDKDDDSHPAAEDRKLAAEDRKPAPTTY